MSYIVVGGGSARALLKVEKVPTNDEVIQITEEMLISGETSNCTFLIGDLFRFTREGVITVRGYEEPLPLFGIHNTGCE